MGRAPSRNQKTVYVCRSCGHQSLKWLGRCPACAEWNTLLEEMERAGPDRPALSDMGTPTAIDAIPLSAETRMTTGIEEWDRTLGGGFVQGSLILVGGDPGIGKSTLILQVLDALARSGVRTLYCSGEESREQIRLRAGRLRAGARDLYVVTGTCLEALLDRVDGLKPGLLAVDSVQTLYTEGLPSATGSLGQVREVTYHLMAFAKRTGVPVILIGHVTKEGSIAGPKVLEHMVDTVLYFEGDATHVYRILRSVKNRYGSTNEIGVFEMKETGLAEVRNPSRIFLQERPPGVSGSVVIPCVEGTRPLLVEIQALVGPSPFGVPRRTSVGFDPNRVSLLVAVLGKHMGMELGDRDIFVNVVGGLRLEEPAADLGVVSALISSYLDRPVNQNLVVFGEVGLSGEIRGVSHPDIRLNEARKLGFSKGILSRRNAEALPPDIGLRLMGVESVKELLKYLFS